jgi:hypothetical protein
MNRSLLFLLLLFFGCRTEEEKTIIGEQEEFVITSPKEVLQPQERQRAKPTRRVAAPSQKPETEAAIVEKETPTKEPKEEINTALNNVVFEESFGWRAMNAVPVLAPPKHPDSLKWEDIAGRPFYVSETPWWVKALGYVNIAAALGYITYLLVTGK